MATDPRASLPDVILTAPDGEKILSRVCQLMVKTPRGGAISIKVDNELYPVRQEVDGEAVKLGRQIDVAPRDIPLSGSSLSPPPELQAMLAAWAAGLAEPLARLHPCMKESQP